MDSLPEYARTLSGACNLMAQDLQSQHDGKTPGEIVVEYMEKAKGLPNQNSQEWLIWNAASGIREAALGPLYKGLDDAPEDILEGVQTALRMLPSADRELLLDRYGRDLTLQTIAQKRGCSREWVRLSIEAALKELRRPPLVFYIRKGVAFTEDLLKRKEVNQMQEALSMAYETPDAIVLDDLQLSTRTLNVLKRAKMHTVGDLRRYMDRNTLANLRGAGKTVTYEILHKLQEIGL